jgi:hypothetical protein
MLKTNPDHVIVFFVAEYEPQVGFMGRVPEASEAVLEKLKTPHWVVVPSGTTLLRYPERKVLVVIDHRRVVIQTLGLLPWQSGLPEHVEIVKIALRKMRVEKVKRLLFKSLSFLPLGMLHAEMVSLMYGSFLASAEDLEGVCGKPDDALVQIHGARMGMSLKLIVAPMTPEHVLQQLHAISGLDNFLEPKLFDSSLKEFKDRICADNLHVDLELSRDNAAPEEILYFVNNSLAEADVITQAVIRKLKGYPGKGTDHDSV